MNILVCVKRVPLTGGKIVLTDDERAISTRHLGFTVSPHEECGAEEAVRLVEQHGGSSHGADARPARGRGAAARHDGDRDRPRDPPRHRRLASGIRRRPRQAIVEAIQRRGRAARPDPVRQRVRRRRQLPGGDPGRARARAAVVTGVKGDHRRATAACAASRRSPAGATSTSCRCRPSSPSRRGSTCRATRRSPAGCAPSASRSRPRPPARPEPKLEMVRLALPPGVGQAGRGARQRRRGGRRAVVGVLQRSGLV